MGPLALLLARLPRPVYVVLVAAAVALCLHWFCDAVVDSGSVAGDRVWDGRRLVLLAAGGALVVAPWAQLAWKGHADDALLLTGSALLLSSAARGGAGLGPVAGAGHRRRGQAHGPGAAVPAHLACAGPRRCRGGGRGLGTIRRS